jgi:nitronate monooxygenase
MRASLGILDAWLDTLTWRLARPPEQPPARAMGAEPDRAHDKQETTRRPRALREIQSSVCAPALGSPKATVSAVHEYGGKIYADVSTPEYAQKALQANIDEVDPAVRAPGPHGHIAAPAFVAAVREFWDGQLFWPMSHGNDLRAAQLMGTPISLYMGTRFICISRKRGGQSAINKMVIDCSY